VATGTEAEEEYRVVMIFVPRYPAEGREGEAVAQRYPAGESRYTREQAVDVLRIFTERWRLGGSQDGMEPYAYRVGSTGSFTLAEMNAEADAASLVEAVRDPEAWQGRRAKSRRRGASPA
jgi:hypothetical protein